MAVAWPAPVKRRRLDPNGRLSEHQEHMQKLAQRREGASMVRGQLAARSTNSGEAPPWLWRGPDGEVEMVKGITVRL